MGSNKRIKAGMVVNVKTLTDDLKPEANNYNDSINDVLRLGRALGLDKCNNDLQSETDIDVLYEYLVRTLQVFEGIMKDHVNYVDNSSRNLTVDRKKVEFSHGAVREINTLVVTLDRYNVKFMKTGSKAIALSRGLMEAEMATKNPLDVVQ